MAPLEPRRQRLQRQVRREQRRRALRRTSALGIVLVLVGMALASTILPGSAANELTISPGSGVPGANVNVSGRLNAFCSSADLRFEQGDLVAPLGTFPVSSDSLGSNINADVTVPDGAAPGSALIVASCTGGEGNDVGNGSFTVLDPTPPTVTVEPDRGRPGDTAEATATDHECVTVTFFLRGVPVGSGPQGSPVTITVPADAAPGTTLLTSSCNSVEDEGVAADGFTVLDATAPALSLTPSSGLPGSTFDIFGTGHLNECGDSSFTIHVFVDGQALDVVELGVDPDEFTLEGVDVPIDATGDLTVTTHCFKDGSDGPLAEATFDVVFPSLFLFPDEGEVGETFTVEGSNHGDCFAGVDVFFEDTKVDTVTPSEAGFFETTLTVPDVAAGAYTVATKCVPVILLATDQVFTDQVTTAAVANPIATASFTVVDPTPTLFADPTFGLPGATVILTGADHDACNNNVVLKFDSTVLATVNPTLDSFSTQVTVPANAAKGSHTFSSHCNNANSAVVATASFEVVGLIPTLVATPIGTGGVSPAVMAQNLAGEGVTVSNVKYTGAPAASGTFRTDFVPDEPSSFDFSAAAVPNLIGFPEGIILSSGEATNITGRNNDDGITGGLGLPGDPALDALSKVDTNDASILEFDFVPAEDKVAFQYVFASDEYNEFVNSSFNDVFAFFVNGQNCAVVPGTNTPVSINTINNGNPLGSGGTNPSLYRNNDPSDGGAQAAPTIEPDGFTTVLKCQSTVKPNQTNTMKLAIADGSDSSLDSWVFLAADSLTSVPVTTTPTTTPPSIIPPVSFDTIPTTTLPPGTPDTTTPPFNGPFVVTTLADGDDEVEIEETAAPGTTTPVTVLGSQDERDDEPPQRGEDRGTFENRSKFTDSLFRPDDISGDLGLLAQNAGLSLLLVLLIMFPAELFNKTYEENQSTIRGWFQGIRRFGRRAKAALDPIMGEQQVRNTFIRTPLVLLGFAGVTAVLYGALDPTLGLNKGSAALLLGFLGAILLVSMTYELTAARYIKRKLGITGQMKAFPGAMVVAIACIAVSRAVDFAPGYLFGIIAGFQFHGDLSDEDEGKAIAFGALNMLILGLVAWFLWAPVDSLVNRSDPNFGLLALDAVLAATFVAAIEGLIFGLLPLRFLDGEKVLRYSQAVWVGLFGLGIFTFVHVLLHPRTGYIPTSEAVSVFTVVLLFAAFGLFSFAFWGYFKLREEPADDEEEDEPIYLT